MKLLDRWNEKLLTAALWTVSDVQKQVRNSGAGIYILDMFKGYLIISLMTTREYLKKQIHFGSAESACLCEDPRFSQSYQILRMRYRYRWSWNQQMLLICKSKNIE